jgi:hypothetical protein
MHRNSPLLSVCLLLILQPGCTAEHQGSEGSGMAADKDAGDAAEATIGASAQDSALRSAAEGVVAFLRGEAEYESLNLADTVELVLPAEGGGTRRRVDRETLRNRRSWFVEANGQQYSFMPPADFAEIRVASGRHFNCVEGPLAARVPDLASLPHIGVRAEPSRIESCMQGWNATFVFDNVAGEPRLSAAVYDQWEW